MAHLTWNLKHLLKWGAPGTLTSLLENVLKKKVPIFLSPECTHRHTPPHNESERTHKHGEAPRCSVCAKFRLRPRYEPDLLAACVCASAKRPPNLRPSSFVYARWRYGELTVTSNLLRPRRRNEPRMKVRPGRPASQKKRKTRRVWKRGKEKEKRLALRWTAWEEF